MRLKISKWLSRLSQWAKYKSTYYELSHYVYESEIKHKSINNIKEIGHYDRNIGKSYALVKLALDYDLPIAVPHRSSGEYLRRLAEQYFYSHELKIIVTNESAKGKRYNTILLEEGVDENILNCLIRPMCKNLIGYRYID